MLQQTDDVLTKPGAAYWAVPTAWLDALGALPDMPLVSRHLLGDNAGSRN